MSSPDSMSSQPKTLTASPHDSARGSPELLDDFDQLVLDINRVLGPTNGIDSEGVDPEELKRVMAEYTSEEAEWKKFAFADRSRAYTRNLVDRGNGKSNLLILVWTPGKSSPIHDHANAHCVMKILSGSLTETVYGWPCQRSADAPACAAAASSEAGTEHTCSAKAEDIEPHALYVNKTTTYQRDQVTYMSDGLGLHRITNPSSNKLAVSLHLYTPPNAAKHGCHVFDESTGKSSHVKQCHFYSELGLKM